MTGNPADTVDAEWHRYGKALLHAMADVRAETPETAHEVLMETADYWFSLGLVVGSTDAASAARLLALIEREEPARQELIEDAGHFVSEALG